MRKRKISVDGVVTSALVLLLLAGTTLRIASAGQSNAGTRPHNVAVYVRDFELSVAPTAAPNPTSPAYRDEPAEDLQLRSRQVQDHFAETLVEALRNQGYSSSRNQALSGNGILLEGVFAEPDQKNRIRRALLGSESPGSKRTLYVGVFDFGWTKHTGAEGHNICIESFGASAPRKQLLKKFGFSAEKIVAAAKSQIAKHQA